MKISDIKEFRLALFVLTIALLVAGGRGELKAELGFPEDPVTPTPTPYEFEQIQPKWGKKKILLSRCQAQVYRVEVLTTNLPEEVMVKASSPFWNKVARLFGRRVVWSPERGILMCSGGDAALSVRLGQKRLPDTPEGRELGISPQLIDGIPYIPISVLEDFLNVRLTFKDDQVFIEPVISAVQIKSDKANTSLVIQVTAPVTYKTFTLKNPARYVIDIQGAVLDTPRQVLHHPVLGLVRTGQFELAPAVSRIVIPVEDGVTVSGSQSGSGQTLVFNLKLPGKEMFKATRLQPVTGLSVESIRGGHRVVVQGRGAFRYRWHRLQAPDNRFFLDIEHAVLEGKKRIVSVDDPFLSEVRLSQFRVDPYPVVRLVFDLKRPCDIRFKDGGDENTLIVDLFHREIDPAKAVLQGWGTTALAVPGGVICIDPGHGGSDPGAINRRLKLEEKDVTLDIALKLAAILRQQGWNVVLTRDTDRDVTWAGSSARVELGARVKIANDLKADVFVSIHCNASVNPGRNGTSIHYFKRSDKILALELRKMLLAATGRPDRGIRKNRFYVLAHTQMPAVLVETAYITNPIGAKLLGDDGYRQRIAQALARGLRQYAGRHMRWVTAGRN